MEKTSKFTFSKIISTVFGAGYSPFAPGTAGSFAAILVYYFIKGDYAVSAAIIIISTILGFITIGKAEKDFGAKDPKYIVLDEFIGMFIALCLLPYNLLFMALGFFLFRLFDVLKPPPLRAIEKFPGAIGVIGDDVGAGIYTNIILQIVRLATQ